MAEENTPVPLRSDPIARFDGDDEIRAIRQIAMEATREAWIAEPLDKCMALALGGNHCQDERLRQNDCNAGVKVFTEATMIGMTLDVYKCYHVPGAE